MNAHRNETKKSEELWQRACNVIMDGTQLYSKGPMIGVDGVYPKYLRKGKGSHVWDVDGNEFIDYTSGVGSVVLGYGYERVKDAISKQLEDGTNLGLIHPLEVEVAELICETIPCAEKVRFLKTGADATSAAARIMRAYTGRDLIIKGEYHGWHDWCMAASKRNAGIPETIHNSVIYAEYNDLKKLEELFLQYPDRIAGIIMEPVQLDPPEDNYLVKMKALCHEHGALLVFDEIVTGFRFDVAGAQKYFNVIPDMACFGKGIANGMPLSCVAGRREIFDRVQGRIFMSTTFGGEMLSLAAAKANILEIKEKNIVRDLWKKGEQLKEGANTIFRETGADLQCKGYPVRLLILSTYPDPRQDVLLRSLFLQEVVKRGVLMAWQMFPMYMHSEEDIRLTLDAFRQAAMICRNATDQNNVADRLEGKPVDWIEVL
ncbi:MAG: aspartate aminotransferase family protein [Bacteroidales bacterium]|nr:aspartate aminotransferase family protein [Bacteroidales bacterium]